MYSQSPDDDVFRHLSATYANSHKTMSKGAPCWGEDDSFPGGIVNGAQWYPVVGKETIICRCIVVICTGNCR